MFLKLVFQAVSFLFNSHIGQRLLESLTRGILALSGIGNGAGIDKSGEFTTIKNILKIKSDNYVVFDVGANRGQFRQMAKSILQQELPNGNFQIYSFEPSRSTFEMLVKGSDQLERQYLNNFGLGNSEKKSTLYYDVVGSGLASQSKRDLSFIHKEMNMNEEIEIRTLDLFCQENSISNIDLLKIDVEGYEMDVLEGASTMINSNKVRSIMFEFGGTNIDTRTYFKDFYQFFSTRGFKIYRITPLGYLFPIDAYKEIYEQFKTTNFLVMPE